jgi:Ca-activated chloride channel family protein
MRGERLDKMRAAVRLVMGKLAPDDMLSIVTFSDRADVVLPAVVLGLHAAQTGHSTIDALAEPFEQMVASGGTEIYQGLAAGVNQIRQADLAKYTNQLILLTDGHTYGDAPDCLALAQHAAADGIGFSAFGIGADWNDQFLDALVAPSAGQSGYIERPSQIIDYLDRRIRGLGEVYARDVRLHGKWPRQITPLECFKLSPFAQPLSLEGEYTALGQIEGRSPLTLLLELQIGVHSVPARIKIPLTITAAIPANERHDDSGRHEKAAAEQTLNHQVQLVIMKSPTEDKAPPTELIEAVRLLTLHRMHEKAWQEAESGQLQAAATRLQQLTTRLLESGEIDLAHQSHQEAQRITRLGSMSLEGHKLLKYGTRSLLGQSER